MFNAASALQSLTKNIQVSGLPGYRSFATRPFSLSVDKTGENCWGSPVRGKSILLSADCLVIFPFLDLGMDDEGDDDPVPLPNVNAAILKKVRCWKLQYNIPVMKYRINDGVRYVP